MMMLIGNGRHFPRLLRIRWMSSSLNYSVSEDDEDDNEHSVSSDLAPWKTLLERAARASWRSTQHNEDAPESGFKTKHSQPVFRQIMQIHEQQATAREAERKKVLLNLRQDVPSSPTLVYGRAEAAASLEYRFAANRAVTRRILQECRALLPDFRPERVLDLGMGVGSASAAVLDVFKNVDWVHGIEPSETMRQAAQHALDCRLTFSSYLSSSGEASFDLATCAYTLTEMTKGASILAAAALMYEKLKPGGVALFVEPGTPDGFGSLRTVRNMLLASNEGSTTDVCTVIAPCTHQGPCPIQQFERPRKRQEIQEEPDDEDTQIGFCSFVHSFPPKEGRTRSEKFSYLVVQKQGSVNGKYELRADLDVATLLKSAVQAESEASHSEILKVASKLEDDFIEMDDEDHLGLECVREKRESFGRIIRAPLKRKGHVFIECCTAPGRTARYRVAKSSSQRAPGIYAAARKSRWGGFWPHVEDLEG